MITHFFDCSITISKLLTINNSSFTKLYMNLFIQFHIFVTSY